MAFCRLNIEQSVDLEIEAAIDLQINTQLSMLATLGRWEARLQGWKTESMGVLRPQEGQAGKGRPELAMLPAGLGCPWVLPCSPGCPDGCWALTACDSGNVRTDAPDCSISFHKLLLHLHGERE